MISATQANTTAAEAVRSLGVPSTITRRIDHDLGWRYEVGPAAIEGTPPLGTSDLLVRAADGRTRWIAFGMLDDDADKLLSRKW